MNPVEQKRLLSRRNFLKLFLAVPIIAAEEFIRLTDIPAPESKRHFQDIISYDENIAEETINLPSAEVVRSRYTYVEQVDWTNKFEQAKQDREEVLSAGIFILEKKDDTSAQAIIHKLLDILVSYSNLGATAKDHEHFLSTSYDLRENPLLMALTLQNVIKYEAFCVLRNIARFASPFQQKAVQAVEDIDFYGPVTYHSSYGKHANEKVQLFSRHEHTLNNDIQRAAFLPENLSTTFPIGKIILFDWREAVEGFNPDFYYSTQRDGKHVVFASELSPSKQNSVPVTEHTENRVFTEGNTEYRVGPDYFNQAREVRITDFFDTVIKPLWPTIFEVSKKYQQDPFLIATMMLSEHCDARRHELDGHIGTEFAKELEKEISELSPFLQQLIKTLWPVIDGETSDFLGAIKGDATSVGLGQVNITVAKSEQLVEVAGRVVSDNTPNWFVALLLKNPYISVETIAKYLQSVTQTLQNIQDRGDNWYLPNTASLWDTLPVTQEYDPGHLDKLVAMGSWYTAPPYGLEVFEYSEMEQKYKRFPTADEHDWGDNVKNIYGYLLSRAPDLDVSAVEYRAKLGSSL